MSKKDKNKECDCDTCEDCESIAEEITDEAAETLGDVDSKEKDELAEANDKFIRLYADFENYKKRTRAEKDILYTTAKADTIAALLPVLDNLDRAVMASSEENSPLKTGVDMVLSQFYSSLEQIGVTTYGEKGDEFNPNIHEAIMHTEEEGVEANTITEVMQKGYRVGDKIIRHALVKVAN